MLMIIFWVHSREDQLSTSICLELARGKETGHDRMSNGQTGQYTGAWSGMWQPLISLRTGCQWEVAGGAWNQELTSLWPCGQWSVKKRGMNNKSESYRCCSVPLSVVSNNLENWLYNTITESFHEQYHATTGVDSHVKEWSQRTEKRGAGMAIMSEAWASSTRKFSSSCHANK